MHHGFDGASATVKRCLLSPVLLCLGAFVDDIGGGVVVLFDDNDLIDGHGDLKTILVLYQHDVFALEASYLSAADLTEKTYFVSYLHILKLLTNWNRHSSGSGSHG